MIVRILMAGLIAASFASLRAADLPAPPAIVKANDILALGNTEAGKLARPVRVQGVVTFCAPEAPWFFLQDASAGILVALTADAPRVSVGQFVTAEGKTGAGNFAPYILSATATATASGTAPMPKPVVASNAQVERQRSLFGQWTETEGILRDAARGPDGRVRLLISSRQGSCSAVLHGDGSPWLERDLIDARLRVRGICWLNYECNLQVVPSADNITVLERSAAPGFDRPPVPAASLRGQNKDMPALLRATFVREEVLGRWRLVAEDGTPIMGLPASPMAGSVLVKKPIAPAPGAAVDIAGRVDETNNFFTVHHMWSRDAGAGHALPDAAFTTPSGAGSADRAGHLLTVRGRFISADTRPMSMATAPYATTMIASALLEDEADGARVQILMPAAALPMLRALPDDRLVQVTGWQSPAGSSALHLPQLWPRDETDIAVGGLTRAAFQRNLWWGAGGLGVLVLTGAGFLWAQREKLKRQRSEAAIVAAHAATLEARVAERTAELAAANERLTRASEEALANLAREHELGDLKSNFVSMVSHEFRTPLAVILSSTDILANHLERLSPERRAQQLAGIRSSTQQMARLIEEVLLLGKVEAGKMAFAPEPLNLRHFCSELVDEAHSATARRCPITLECAHDLPELISADPALLRHIFSNLLSNAAKYSPEGAEVKLSVQQETGLLLRIADKGIGIPEADLPHLFEPFHRASNVGLIGGTGLGLMITKRCVELHGGSISVISPPGEGTTVTVRIPFSPKP